MTMDICGVGPFYSHGYQAAYPPKRLRLKELSNAQAQTKHGVLVRVFTPPGRVLQDDQCRAISVCP